MDIIRPVCLHSRRLDNYGMVQNLSQVKSDQAEITSQLDFSYLNASVFELCLPLNILHGYLAGWHPT